MRNENHRLREVTATAPAVSSPAEKLIAQVKNFNALSKHRVSLSDHDVEQLRAIKVDVLAYLGELYRRCGGNETFTTEIPDLENLVSDWVTLQTEFEQRMVGDVEVSTPALESGTIRGFVFAKGEEVASRIEAIEAEIVAAARRRDASRNAEETSLLAYFEHDAIASALADVICAAADEAAAADVRYHAATPQAPVPGGSWRWVETLVAALELRFTERKFSGISASQVWQALSRVRSKGKAA